MQPVRTPLGNFQQVIQCPECDGVGERSTPCETCGGDGRVRKSKRLEVTIPAGKSLPDRRNSSYCYQVSGSKAEDALDFCNLPVPGHIKEILFSLALVTPFLSFAFDNARIPHPEPTSQNAPWLGDKLDRHLLHRYS